MTWGGASVGKLRDKGIKAVERVKTWTGHALHLLSSVCPVSLLNSIYRDFPGQGTPTGLCGVLGPACGEGAVAHRARVPVGSGAGGTSCECFPEELQPCTHGYAWFVKRTSAQLERRGEVCEPGLGENMALGQILEGLGVPSWLLEGLKVSSSF